MCSRTKECSNCYRSNEPKVKWQINAQDTKRVLQTLPKQQVKYKHVIKRRNVNFCLSPHWMCSDWLTWAYDVQLHNVGVQEPLLKFLQGQKAKRLYKTNGSIYCKAIYEYLK